MGFQLLRGDHLYEKHDPSDTFPYPLLRSWEEPGRKPVSLMSYSEIPQFRTAFFARAMELYNTWKLFKQSPPSGQGWANERNVTCTVLRLLETENVKYDAWERELEDERRRK